MQAGDIIIALDGKPVEYVGQLQQQVGFRKPGEKVKVEVARKGGVRKTYEVRLQEVKSTRELAGRSDNGSDNGDTVDDDAAISIDLLGVTVQSARPRGRAAASICQLTSVGVLVTGVTPGGPAYGEVADPDNGGPDIILDLEGKPVKNPAELRQALKNYKAGDIVSLRIYNTQAKNRRIERIRLGSN